MNTPVNTAAAIDELGALKARAKQLEAFLKSDAADFLVDVDGKTRATGDVFQATLSATPDKMADITDWETVARKAGASVQLITAHTERDKVTRKGSTTLRVTPRKDVAADAVAV